MRLSTFSDYSLRVLMYLGLQPGRLATISEIAEAYGISEAHLMKVIHHLGRSGFVETVRGKGGGVRLGRAPQDIVLGDVVRRTENDTGLAGCHSETKSCRLKDVCRLTAILDEALKNLYLVLDGYTVADLVEPGGPLTQAIRFPAPSA
ncbi:MAG: transcriptional regulator, BadM/Rrf2 family [Rhodocyclaceae bacterium]|nr:transcriptional regulator, BadM/Rrf2 family [Rhodocyclaceae bacterium]